MKKLLVVLVILVLIVGGVVAFGLLGGGGAEAALATVSIVKSEFEKQPAGGAFTAAIDGEALNRTDNVRTDTDGRGFLTFFDGSTFEVEPGARVALVELAKQPDGATVVAIEQTLGRSWSSVQKFTNPNSRFEIRTPSATAAVRGTLLEVIVAADGTTTVFVAEGNVDVGGGGATVSVAGGNASTVRRGGQPSPPGPPPDDASLRITPDPGTTAIVADPRGLSCGAGRFEIPRCREGSVLVGDVVGGEYAVTLSNAQGGAVGARIEGLFGRTVVASHQVSGQIGRGERGRTTFSVLLDASRRPTLSAPTPLEVIGGGQCGAETTGRVFARGTLSERSREISQYASSNKDKLVAFVVNQEDLEQVAADALRGQPIGSVSARIAGGHARISAAAALLRANALLFLSARSNDLVARIQIEGLLGAAADQIQPQIERGVRNAIQVPVNWARVAWRDGCFAAIGRTR